MKICMIEHCYMEAVHANGVDVVEELYMDYLRMNHG